jgi:tripartite-type tricarboxylate transporter receptor subunit TctC
LFNFTKSAYALHITVAFLALFASSIAIAQDWPTKPIKLIVGIAPGGGTDAVARYLAEQLTKRLGQSVIVENRPGANSIIATELVAKAPADGYTLLVASSGSMVVNPATYSKLSYDTVRDFIPITFLAHFPVLIATGEKGAKSLDEFVKSAVAKPGEFSYGTASTSFFLAGEIFSEKLGMKMAYIPYKGGVEALQAAASGDIQAVFADAKSAVGLIQSKRIRGLAIASDARLPALPDVPTLAEAGLRGAPSITFFTGLFAPTGTPKAVVDKLYSEAADIMNSPSISALYANIGALPGGGTPEQTLSRIKMEITEYKAVAKRLKVQVN